MSILYRNGVCIPKLELGNDEEDQHAGAAGEELFSTGAFLAVGAVGDPIILNSPF